MDATQANPRGSTIKTAPVNLEPDVDVSMPPESRGRWWDAGIMLGFAISGLVIAGAAMAGKLTFAAMFQQAALLTVIGGTLGAMLVTAPGAQIRELSQRLRSLGGASSQQSRTEFAEDIVGLARILRNKGLIEAESAVNEMSHPVLRQGMLGVIDGVSRDELAAGLELHIRLLERRGEACARLLETAGSFAPSLGVMGTVFGLLDVMRGFANLATVAAGAGTAFVSTLYGLALANLVLIPLAHRVRASVAAQVELDEMAAEGVLCIRDGLPPRQLRERLRIYEQ